MKRLIMLIVLLLVPLTGAAQVPCPPGSDCSVFSQGVVNRSTTVERRRASAPKRWRFVTARAHQRAVVRIECEDRDGQSSFGSGVLVLWRGKKVVLTAFHVIKDARRILVRLVTNKSGHARVLGFDRRWDVAVLKIDDDVDPTVAPARMAEGAAATPTANPPQRLWTYGFGGPGSQLAVMEGEVRGFRTWRDPPSGPTDWVAITGAVREGASGGPVFDSQGRVVAVFWGADETEMIATQGGKLQAMIKECCFTPHTKRPLVPVRPHVCPGCSSFQEQITALQEAVAELKTRGDTLGEVGEAGPPGPQGIQGIPGLPGADVNYESLVLRLSAVESVAERALTVASKPLYVKKINTATGEETVEEVHLGEGLIFKMTPHDLSQLTKREAQ